MISKHDSSSLHESYCGHAHMGQEEYWYFADTFDDTLLSSSMIRDVSPWCEDNNDSCYCELRELIGMDRKSYESFFRTHVSETCPVILMPKTVTSFDPTKCEWIEDKNTTWVSLPITSCSYPWHESNHEKTKQYYAEYRNIFGNYDSSDPQENAGAMHYAITRYYEDLGIDILDVVTLVDHSVSRTGERCNATVGATWHLKIQNDNLEYFLDNGYVEQELETKSYPFGIMGPMMSQQNCNDYVIAQWQPTVEGREMIQQFFEICIAKGFTTPELVERGKIADNFTMGSIQSAQTIAGGDIGKTIEVLEEMYRENES